MEGIKFYYAAEAPATSKLAVLPCRTIPAKISSARRIASVLYQRHVYCNTVLLQYG